MRGGGAGSAHSSCEDVGVGSGVSSIVDGVGDGGTAGSAHSSLEDIARTGCGGWRAPCHCVGCRGCRPG